LGLDGFKKVPYGEKQAKPFQPLLFSTKEIVNAEIHPYRERG